MITTGTCWHAVIQDWESWKALLSGRGVFEVRKGTNVPLQTRILESTISRVVWYPPYSFGQGTNDGTLALGGVATYSTNLKETGATGPILLVLPARVGQRSPD